MVERTWQLVFSQILGFEDAHALMDLFEQAAAAQRTLTANGVPIDALTAPVYASERAVAQLLARRMIDLTGDDGWSYTHFTAGSRDVEATADEVASFRQRCRACGVLVGP